MRGLGYGVGCGGRGRTAVLVRVYDEHQAVVDFCPETDAEPGVCWHRDVDVDVA